MPFALTLPKWLPDGQHIIVGTSVIAELAGSLGKKEIAATKREVVRRKDAKMTAKVTENRQYRHFDHYLTDNLASRLLRVHVATKEIADLTPGFDRWFAADGELSYDISPDGSQIAVAINSTRPPYRESLNSDIYLLPTNGAGQMKNLTAENPGWDNSPVLRPTAARSICARNRRFTTASLPVCGALIWRPAKARRSPTSA